MLLQSLAVHLLHQPLAHLLGAALQLAVLALGAAGFILTQLPVAVQPLLLLRLGQAALQGQGLERVYHAPDMCVDLRYAKVPAKKIRIPPGQRVGRMGMPMPGSMAVPKRRHGAARIWKLLKELAGILLPEEVAQFVVANASGLGTRLEV